MMDTIILNRIEKSLDRLTTIEYLKEMRETMEIRYELGSITKETYENYVIEEMRTIQKVLEEAAE